MVNNFLNKIQRYNLHLEIKIKFVTLQSNHGVLAQLVERLNGIQKVRSSILLCSTKPTDNQCSYRVTQKVTQKIT